MNRHLLRSYIEAALIVSASCLSTQSLAQTVVGNGGDPIMLIFKKAKIDAAYMVDHLDLAHLPDSMDPSVRAFLTTPSPQTGLVPGEHMAEDIRKSEHDWTTDPNAQPKCAFTNVPPILGTIHLSIPWCRTSVFAAVDAEAISTQLLIHESSHHFGLASSGSEEELASLVGIEIYNAWVEARNLAKPHWVETTLVGVPENRYLHTAVFTGATGDDDTANKMIVWGGCNYSELPDKETCSLFVNSGGIYSVPPAKAPAAPSTGKWLATSPAHAPIGRKLHTAVWTGSSTLAKINNSMIVWGGCRGDNSACSQSFGDGAFFDPKANSWSSTPSQNAPTARVRHTATWLGANAQSAYDGQMLIWGGLLDFQSPTRATTSTNTGAVLRFSPAHPEGVWTETSTLRAPSPRFGHVAVAVGSKVLIWGGCDLPGIYQCRHYYNDGAIYDPEHDTWEVIPSSPFVEGRINFAYAWTGDTFIVWGGQSESGKVLSSGGMFANGVWTPMSDLLPAHEDGRYGHQAIWDAKHKQFLVWGGQSSIDQFVRTTLALDLSIPDAPRWSTLDTDVTPIGRKGQTTLWTGDAMLIWGGFGEDTTFLYTGGILHP